MAGRPSSGGFERSVDTAERDAQAARLRAKRWSYPRIANELGYYDRSSAHKGVMRCLAATQREAGDELRAVESEALDRMSERLWQVVETVHYAHGSGGRVVKLDGIPLIDDGPIMQAMDRLLRVAERRAKLWGLDAPIRHTVQTIDAIDAEIAELEARVAQRATASEAAPPTGAAGAS